MLRAIRPVMIFCICVGAVGQVGETRRALRNGVAVRIGELSRQLHFRDAETAERYRAIRDQATSQIQHEVDAFLTQEVDPAHTDSAAVEQDLAELLSAHRYDPEYSGNPFASVFDSSNGRSMLVGYMLVRGGDAVNDSAITIRAYHEEGGRFRLVATTGSDLDGYGLFVRQLPSPVPSEKWVLAWGALSGFNGNKVRIRVYSYDGSNLRTVWKPQDLLNATINIGDHGFSIRHLDENRYFVVQRPPYFLREEYALGKDGPHLAASYYDDGAQ
jgi:hypothetical protein